MFEKVLIENYAILYENDSALIKCRMALMMGFFADHLFRDSNELFLKTIEFLLKGLAKEKSEKALALQCADTLKDAIGDSDLVNRLEAFINTLFPLLTEMVSYMDLPSFYESLMTIISCYANSIDSSMLKLLESLVARVDKEYKELQARGERNNMTINQCWNVIRAIGEQSAFFPVFMDSIENALLPMFNYLVDPTDIEFDDDIMQVICALITKRGDISENMAKIFPYLPNFFEKYNRSFGSLFQTLNCYLYYGKNIFAANKSWIETIVKLVVESLYSTREIAEVNNSEGAILGQILLQTAGNGVLDLYIPLLIEQALKRLSITPTADYLSRELYNLILCAICNNALLALNKIESQGSTETLFTGIIAASGKYQANYDVKVLVIGLSNIMIQSTLPPFLSKSLAKILEVIVNALQRQTVKDAKQLIKTDKKDLGLDDNGSNSSGEEFMSEMVDEAKEEDKKIEYALKYSFC